MKPLFAILICHLTERKQLLNRLIERLEAQKKQNDCLILIEEDQGQKTTGEKRNINIQKAIERGATHVAHFDDDDLPGDNYVKLNVEATNQGFDTMELYGQYFEHGKQMMPFHHSLKYDHWWQDDKYYYRCNNHLNMVSLEKTKGILFPEKTVGEDGVWSMAVQKAGVLKTEYPINEIIYFYWAGRRNHNEEELQMLRRGITL